MNVTIHVELTTDWSEADTFEISEIERRYRELDGAKHGSSRVEGKDALQSVANICGCAS
ncbi:MULTISPECIES: hypothetical protein [Paraburkholderia]|uniref:Uncharacterized protein n=1 Tax=Paraburkholderia nemoris TaxID=2793076 RepID=A0ABM8T2U7_9BURK|nr:MULTISPECIES: hypothetical protein [Paraburkholderia]MBK5152687.1 hypothetical protein [Burkholderia sp. R-69608]MBK5184518.1 hypothetical protein [Burkholderia sp. R-69749]MBK3743448.1 hypothetical protein [Paraburkholderia aspalathi]MBK3816444.1 hypothetical protein [Paraburkholderia aspalathi]CAE6811988.1 hypothetical protein R69619_05707 [Paraburkholderia nemoris]